MAQFYRVAPLPFLYANAAQVTWASTTTLSIAGGQFRDNTNSDDMVVSSPYVTPPVTLNAAVNGINGLDTGSLAASTWYYVFMIADSSNRKVPGFLLSTSATAPLLPFGYDVFTLIDYQLSDGSSHLLKNYNFGASSFRTKYWDTIIASNVTSGASQTLANVTLAGIPPIDNIPALLQVAFTPNASGDYVSFAVAASTATVLPAISGFESAKVCRAQIEILSKLVSSAPTIQYINSAATGATSVSVYGFRYNV
jgi:hypothetical protein